MFTILLHSSKTMRSSPQVASVPQSPVLLDRAVELHTQLAKLSVPRLMKVMKISRAKAEHTKTLIDAWSTDARMQTLAIDAFVGDIYSGLQVASLSDSDRSYANNVLVLLSGLYGVLRPLDGIMPYRLEMAYKLPGKKFNNLYEYWGDAIVRQLLRDRTIINVSSVEYTRAALPYLSDTRVITPKFLTRKDATGEPTFVTVHSKITRGAYAHWIIKNRIEDVDHLSKFDELNYTYDQSLSTADEPVYVCDTFGGLGLSVRLAR